MKHAKTGMLLAAALALFGAQASWGETVVSSNVVGYNKVTLQPGFNMLGVQFKAIGLVGNAINIQDLVKPDGLVGYDWDELTGGDTLLIWDPENQMYNETYIWAGTEDTTDVLEYDISNTWFDEGTLESANVTLSAGSAFWIRTAGSTATVTFAGEVPDAGSNQFSVEIVAGGFTMVANPYPAALNINTDMLMSGFVGYDWDELTGGDTLLIWDPENQMYNETYIWAGTEDTTDVLEYDISNTWFDEGTLESANATVPVGGAMWIRHGGTSAATITFKKPSE